jgi:hypothetical protein
MRVKASAGTNVQGPSVHMNAVRECSVDEGVWGHMKEPAGTKCSGSICTVECGERMQR